MKKSRINKYINLEASESDSCEESEDLDYIQERLSISTYTDIAKQIEEKYMDYDDQEYSQDQEYQDQEYTHGQVSYVPTKSAPRLFLVRVKYNKEKEIALRILNNKPNICSVMVKDGLKGYLYVEAFQKQQVLDSFDKIRGINKLKLTIVPQNEMIEAITYNTDHKHVEFGRIRKGKYKGDLVQIVANDGEMVRVRVVPRINNIKKLFDPSEYGDEAFLSSKSVKDTTHNEYIYKRDVYVNGYLEKEMLRSNLNFDVEPNYEELEQFNVQKKFESGDKVEVIKGELIGIKGVVQSTTGELSVIKSDGHTYECITNMLTKYFDIGEEVRYKNENGIITNIQDNLYYVAIKNFTEEVAVSITELSKPIPVTKEVIRGYKIKNPIKKDYLINKQVQVKKGMYKGYIGIVKDVYMDTCRVQISSNLKSVTVPKEHISIAYDKQEYEKQEFDSQTNICYTSAVTKTPAYEQEGFVKYDSNRYMSNDTIDESRKGALVRVHNKMCTVLYTQGNTFVTNDGSYTADVVQYVTPNKDDTVIVMEGIDIGKSAIVLGYDEDTRNCMIKIINGNIKNVPITVLTRRAM